jgi:hypothetical protein
MTTADLAEHLTELLMLTHPPVAVSFYRPRPRGDTTRRLLLLGTGRKGPARDTAVGPCQLQRGQLHAWPHQL